MRVTCTHNKLKEAVENSERVITRNLTLPILNNLLIKAEKTGVTISATNLEIGVKCWFSCKVEKQGEISVPAKILSGIVNNINTDNIQLDAKDETTLNIKAGNYKGELKGHPAKDFPIIPKIERQQTIKINAADLSSGIGKTIPFTSVSETRPEITGILFHKEKNQESFNIVSTDSFRLAEKKVFIKDIFKREEFSFIIPQKTASEILKLSGGKGEIEIIASKNQIALKTPQNELISRLIDGNYPDYENFIPRDFKTEILADKEELIKAIKLVSLLSSRINDIRLSINNGEKQTLSVFAKDPDLGENKTSVDIQLTGAPIEVNFNWHYLLEGLQHIEGKKVNLKFVDNTKPALVRSPEDTTYVYIVMPIRA